MPHFLTYMRVPFAPTFLSKIVLFAVFTPEFQKEHSTNRNCVVLRYTRANTHFIVVCFLRVPHPHHSVYIRTTRIIRKIARWRQNSVKRSNDNSRGNAFSILLRSKQTTEEFRLCFFLGKNPEMCQSSTPICLLVPFTSVEFDTAESTHWQKLKNWIFLRKFSNRHVKRKTHQMRHFRAI